MWNYGTKIVVGEFIGPKQRSLGVRRVGKKSKNTSLHILEPSTSGDLRL